MSEQEFNELRDLGRRRPLTAAEEARLREYLVAHPEDEASWEREAELTQMLAEMANAPVPSNFTSRVLQAVELDRKASERSAHKPSARGLAGWLRPLMPRVSWAVAGLVGSVLALWLFQGYQETKLEQGMVMLVESVHAAPVSDPVVFSDFDPIRRLPPEMDEELWAALQP